MPLLSVVIVLLVATTTGANADQQPSPPPTVAPRAPLTDLEREVQHELVTLPQYGVFDHLAFKVESGVVTLLGQVRSGALKDDAERALRDVAGVREVANRIELLPSSIGDDRIRVAAFRAIYGHSALERYAFMAVPPIHIIVSRGHITLEGAVARKFDKTIATAQARSVDGVFSVTDHLVVER